MSSDLQVIAEYLHMDEERVHRVFEDMQRTFMDLKRAEGKYYGIQGMAEEFRAWAYGQKTFAQKQREDMQHMTPAERLAYIDAQLDIIKGRVETPKGYSITPAQVKALIRERESLRSANVQ